MMSDSEWAIFYSTMMTTKDMHPGVATNHMTDEEWSAFLPTMMTGGDMMPMEDEK